MEEVPKEILKRIFDKVNSEDTFARLIGMKLIELQLGFARATLSVTHATINIYQMAHGKWGAAGKSGDLLQATAKVTNRSNRIGLIEFEVRNQEGLLLSTGQQLIYFKNVK